MSYCSELYRLLQQMLAGVRDLIARVPDLASDIPARCRAAGLVSVYGGEFMPAV
jgi:hypothetical protein